MDDPQRTVGRRAKLLGCGISGGIYSAVCCGVPLFFESRPEGRPGSPLTQVYVAFLYCTPVLFVWLGSVLAKRFDARGGKHRKAR